MPPPTTQAPASSAPLPNATDAPLVPLKQSSPEEQLAELAAEVKTDNPDWTEEQIKEFMEKDMDK